MQAVRRERTGAGARIRAAVEAWPGVEVWPHRFGGVEFRVGRRELGHLHSDRVADLPFPRKLRDELVAASRALPHPVLPDSGGGRVRAVTGRYDRSDGEAMKELHGTATSVVSAPLAECHSLLAAVDRYPAWYPDVVKQVEVLDRDDRGHPSRARAVLHVSLGPVIRDFHLVFAVDVEPATVKLNRIPHDAGDRERFDVIWLLDGAGDTRIRLELGANLSLPRLVPLGGVGDSLAHGFVSAAARALR